MAKAETTTQRRSTGALAGPLARRPWVSASKHQAARRRELTEAIRRARAS
jgi:hypothetical protein